MDGGFNARFKTEDSSSLFLRAVKRGEGCEIVYISEGITKYGYTSAELVTGRVGWDGIVHGEDREDFLSCLNAQLETGEGGYCEQYRITAKDGRVCLVSSYRNIVRGADGQIYIESCVLDRNACETGLERQQSFFTWQNATNDILKSLHVSDASEGMDLLMEHLGRHAGLSRVMFFIDSADNQQAKLSNQWCAPGVRPRRGTGRETLGFSYGSGIPGLNDALGLSGLCAYDSGLVPDGYSRIFPGAKAAVFLPVSSYGQRYGVLLLEECAYERRWDADILAFFRRTAKLADSAIRRLRGERALTESHRVCETVLDNISSYIYVTDIETHRLIFVNRAFKRDFGDSCIGKTCWSAVHGYLGEECLACIRSTGQNGQSGYAEVYIEKTSDWLGLSSGIVPWTDGRPVRLINGHKITDIKMHEASMRQMSLMDPLTGLPNRYSCDEDLHTAMEIAEKTGESGYIVFIDMDDFKIINDGFGHDYGDAILVEFADFLRNSIPPQHTIYRFGGDEFVLLIHPGSGGNVEEIVETLLARARQPWKPKDKQFYCTVSVGVAAYPAENGSDAKDIIKNADVAMYKAKKAGKNSFVMYNDDLKDDLELRAELERRMRESISKNFEGFEVYYQPICNIFTKRITGAEALIRWFDPNGTMVMPGQFIQLAEYLGLIVPLGEHVLRTAALECRRINESGMPDFCMNINVSIRQFQMDNIAQRISDVLIETGVNLNNIVLEITEGIAAEDIQRLKVVCEAFREKGVKIAMDDFGTGYSSLNNLRQMPIDIIKIDRSFIRDVTVDAYANSFIRLITDLCHSMGKIICVEGVESSEQLVYCRKTGADLVQGFYIARPLPSADLHELLEKSPAEAPPIPVKQTALHT